MIFIVTFVLALALHLLLGWAWTICAGAIAGIWAVKGGWRIGALAVGAEWLALIIYNYSVAPDAVGEMTRAFGGILGGLDWFVTVILTLLVGLLLGGLGGWFGTQVALMLGRRGTG